MNSLLAQFEAGLGSASSVFVVGAHPDDETVSASACLCIAECRVIQVTDGAPRDVSYARAAGFCTREEYAAARRAESIAALALAGMAPERILQLEYADQEATFAMPRLAEEIAGLLRRFSPSLVVTHPYEGGHPDHDATALAVHAAISLLQQSASPAPKLLEFTSYFGRGGQVVLGMFLAQSGGSLTEIHLSAGQEKLKQEMIAAYRTQRETLKGFPTDCERFREAPRYFFSNPPHSGQLHYEMYNWGVSGERWRRFACETMRKLGLSEPL